VEREVGAASAMERRERTGRLVKRILKEGLELEAVGTGVGGEEEVRKR
jgi:hypothetical protein